MYQLVFFCPGVWCNPWTRFDGSFYKSLKFDNFWFSNHTAWELLRPFQSTARVSTQYHSRLCRLCENPLDSCARTASLVTIPQGSIGKKRRRATPLEMMTFWHFKSSDAKEIDDHLSCQTSRQQKFVILNLQAALGPVFARVNPG